MIVTDRLASMFIDENTKDRSVGAENINQFLESQLDDSRQRLIEHEKKLEEFRRRYAGELPVPAAEQPAGHPGDADPDSERRANRSTATAIGA